MGHFVFLLPRIAAWIEQQQKLSRTPWIFLSGDLGAGKTTLTRELLASLGFDGDEVQSPTFLKIIEYKNSRGTCVHMDAYRIEDSAEFMKLGLEAYENIFLGIVEWPEIFERFLTENPKFSEILGLQNILQITLPADHDVTKFKIAERLLR